MVNTEFIQTVHNNYIDADNTVTYDGRHEFLYVYYQIYRYIWKSAVHAAIGVLSEV